MDAQCPLLGEHVGGCLNQKHDCLSDLSDHQIHVPLVSEYINKSPLVSFHIMLFFLHSLPQLFPSFPNDPTCRTRETGLNMGNCMRGSSVQTAKVAS